MNINIKIKVFNENINIDVILFCILIKGISQPPKKINTNKLDITIIREYSDRKKNTKPTEEYSVLYPETSSDSASGKSKGILDVSASEQIKKRIAAGSKGNINHMES